MRQKTRAHVRVVFLVMRAIVVMIGLVAGVLGYGYCGPDLAPESYRACAIAQSEWLTGWVNDLRYVSVVLGNCRIERVPVEVTVIRDSLLSWWIPLRDVGRLPYTRHATRLEVDVRVCAMTGFRG